MTPPLQLDVRALQSRLFGATKVPEAEQWRLYYGNSVTPARVEGVIRAAQMGYMRDLTDLAYETVAIDPHLGSILGKRFRAIAALDYDVIAASGPGVEPEPASEVADFVRQALARISNLPDAVQALNWGHFDGRACVEKQWLYDPTDPIAWSITELSWMHPRRLSFGPEREVRVNDSLWGHQAFELQGFDTRSVPFKWSTFTPRLFNDYPEREGLAPRCLYFSLFKRFSWRERMVLLEVFGRPWRILWVPDPSLGIVQDGQLTQAQESVDKMAANSTGVLPPGVALQTDQPHPESGQLHKDIAQEADDQNSLLVLGNKRTSDAKSGALGSSADDVAKGEQTEVTMADARNLSAMITAIAREIVLLNLGKGALKYAPKVKFVTEAPPDRGKEIDYATKTVAIGIPVKISEVYEKCGFAQPEPGDDVLQLVSGTSTDAMGNPTSTKAPQIGVMGQDGAIVSAQPSETAEPQDENEQIDPDGDGEPGEPPTDESAGQLAAKMTELQIARCEHGAINRCRICGIERVRDVEMVNGEPTWKLEWRAIPKPAQLSVPVRGTAARPFDGHVCCSRDPDSVFGSPDVIVGRGVSKSTAAIAKWVHALEKAVDGKTTATEIRKAINGANLDLDELASVVEREVMRGVMLGALDSAWERENDEEVKLEAFSRITMASPSPSFVNRPYDAALAFFRSKSILTRAAFDRLSAAAKKRAFTVARLASRELIGTVKSELDRMLELGKGAMIPGTHQGPDLGAFKQFMRDRIESAGWTPANSSHVECLPGDTLVTGAVVGAAHRRWHQGPMVEVVTASGRKFSTTPNHPMLTRRGWVSTGDLQQGDDLVGYHRKQCAVPGRDLNVTAPPSSIAKIFGACSKVGVLERIGSRDQDFHGDGSDGDVDIARPARHLMVGQFAALRKPIEDHVFSPATFTGPRFCSECGHLVVITQRCGFCDAPVGDASMPKNSSDDVVGRAEFSSKKIATVASNVPADNDVFRKVVALSRWLASALKKLTARYPETSRHASLLDRSGDPVERPGERYRNTFDAEPGEIEFDSVVSLRIVEFRGHVFNLSTDHGYFTIDGLFTGNTIYRTNVMTAYGAGRKTEMTQPAVLKARPYWQIRGVRDDRQRVTHAAAVGVVLPADDPFWDRAYPPFGFNCRCRVVSRSEAWVKRTSATIGPVPSDLPDEGWEGSGKL